MLLKFFSSIYETLCGPNADQPTYHEQIFLSVGTITFAVVIGMLLLFYAVLGRWKMVWFNFKHWSITVLITAFAGFFTALLSAKSLLQIAIDGYMWRFASINAIYAAISFALLSILFKNLSVFSKRTPF